MFLLMMFKPNSVKYMRFLYHVKPAVIRSLGWGSDWEQRKKIDPNIGSDIRGKDDGSDSCGFFTGFLFKNTQTFKPSKKEIRQVSVWEMNSIVLEEKVWYRTISNQNMIYVNIWKELNIFIRINFALKHSLHSHFLRACYNVFIKHYTHRHLWSRCTF